MAVGRLRTGRRPNKRTLKGEVAPMSRTSNAVRRLAAAAGCITLAAGILAAQDAARTAPKTYTRISEAEIRNHIDRQWLKKALVNDLLDHWVAALSLIHISEPTRLG